MGRVKTRLKPNTILPSGAKVIPARKRNVGSWLPQVVDAEVERSGVTWYRVKGGLGGRGDREDWVASLPGLAVAVSDYHWNGEDFGPSYGSFDNAIRQELDLALEYAREQVRKAKLNLLALEASEKLLEKV